MSYLVDNDMRGTRRVEEITMDKFDTICRDEDSQRVWISSLSASHPGYFAGLCISLEIDAGGGLHVYLVACIESCDRSWQYPNKSPESLAALFCRPVYTMWL
jgi:hypothetical protein